MFLGLGCAIVLAPHLTRVQAQVFVTITVIVQLVLMSQGIK